VPTKPCKQPQLPPPQQQPQQQQPQQLQRHQDEEGGPWQVVGRGGRVVPSAVVDIAAPRQNHSSEAPQLATTLAAGQTRGASAVLAVVEAQRTASATPLAVQAEPSYSLVVGHPPPERPSAPEALLGDKRLRSPHKAGAELDPDTIMEEPRATSGGQQVLLLCASPEQTAGGETADSNKRQKPPRSSPAKGTGGLAAQRRMPGQA
jgi:hypothetical protein